MQSDACRLQQLQCHSSAPGHPFNRFFWGEILLILSFFLNRKTLCTLICSLHLFIYIEGNKKSLVDAMEKGINLREHILELFENYYNGALMKLVVIGGGESFLHTSVLPYSLYLLYVHLFDI